VECAAAFDRPVFCLSHVYRHHAQASGYHHLAEHLGPLLAPGPVLALLGDTVLRLPAKLTSWYCGAYEYSRHNCIGELGAALHLLRRRNAIYHFLYGEKGFRFSGPLNGVRGNVLIGTFHHAPSRFAEMLPSQRHLRRLEHAIAVGTNQVEMLERLIGAGRVTYVPHGVDVDYWRPEERDDEDRPLRCVFAGQHMRDYVTLEGVIRQVRAARAPVEFVLLSSHEICGAVAGLDGVRWLRRTTDDEYRREMRASDLLLLPLTDSTAVNSVLEALACGAAVVTNKGGVADYLDARCGLVHEIGDVRGMAESVLALAEDRERLTRMQRAARQRACELAWPRVAEQVIDVYRKVISA
jgi:glycosyltransferase involved in cell wall biosynthesis